MKAKRKEAQITVADISALRRALGGAAPGGGGGGGGGTDCGEPSTCMCPKHPWDTGDDCDVEPCCW